MDVKTWHPDPRLSLKKYAFCGFFSLFFLLFGSQTFTELAGEESLHLVFMDSFEKGRKLVSNV